MNEKRTLNKIYTNTTYIYIYILRGFFIKLIKIAMREMKKETYLMIV
jgi:hypothetical protein